MARNVALLVVLCLLGFAILMLWYQVSQGLHLYQISKAEPLGSLNLHYDVRDETVIIYNRIPKTGSTSFMSVMYDLCDRNKFNAIYVNVSSKSHIFSFIDELWFVKNVSLWLDRKPAIYHGHFPFTNFNRLGFKETIYINMVRPPLDRLVSYYYFVRYGDNFRPYLKRSKMGDERSFDECVLEKGVDCQPQKLWLQIPYFCGSLPQCWVPGSVWALDQAKANLVRYYYLVGITEQMDAFIEMLEQALPQIFQGASELFKKDGGTRIRQTRMKKPLQQDTVAYFHKSEIWKLENDFYEFAEAIFKFKLKNFRDSKIVYQKLKPEMCCTNHVQQNVW